MIADVLKFIFLIALLVCFAAIGIGCLVNPDWGIEHFGSIHYAQAVICDENGTVWEFKSLAR